LTSTSLSVEEIDERHAPVPMLTHHGWRRIDGRKAPALPMRQGGMEHWLGALALVANQLMERVKQQGLRGLRELREKSERVN
jgi:hypothetical protein